jgi:hypothetical protein
MMFVTYDQTGMILSTIAGPDRDYGDLLDAHGHSWLFLDGATTLDPRLVHVDVAAKAVVPNHEMALVASKLTIAADNVDASLVTGIPKGAAVSVFCNGAAVIGEIVDDGQIEFTAASPGTFRIAVACATYNPASIEIVAA